MSEPVVVAAASKQAGKTHFVARNWQRIAGAILWLLLLSAYVGYTRANDLSPLGAVQQLIGLMRTSAAGPLIFFAVYLLRPLLFFSAALLTVASGYLFGPLGILYTIVASNASSMLAFAIGRFFGRGVLGNEAGGGMLRKYADRMRNNSFETVLLARFLFLPYDLVSYLAGFLRINWRAFLLATALGSIPGTISFVLFGASIQGDFTGAVPRLDVGTLAIAAGIFACSLLLSRLLRRREAQGSRGLT